MHHLNVRPKPTRAKRVPSWLIIASAALLPGSGHVILGRAQRGFFLLLWMFALGYITSHLSGENVSLIGRWSGGIAVWALSLLEVGKLAIKR